MLDLTTPLLKALPDAPSPELSDKYMFIDSRKVVEDMRDLGLEVANVRRPNFRTKSGAFGVHELDFRRAQDLHTDQPLELIPRVLFINSYDGSRKAQLMTGMFRVICSNGLVAGTTLEASKFLHVGDYTEELLGYIRESARQATRLFDRVERFRTITLDKTEALELSTRAIQLRYPENAPVSPEVALLPRRYGDMKMDLFTVWNVLQENLMKGGVPMRQANGRVRLVPPVQQILTSNKLNAELWDLMEEFAEEV